MSYPINYPTPQNANVQIFTAQAPAGVTRFNQTWIKPQGASFVWFTLIGGGQAGSAGDATGGGSGAVTNFMCPAFLIPDELSIVVGNGGAGSAGASGGATGVYYQQKDGSGYVLLQANPGGGGTFAGGTASTSNYFSAMGFFQSVAGQNGSGGTVNPSATTFLSGGGAGANNVNANYGYTNDGTSGWFQTQPIIVGVGGRGQTANSIGGIGCGGGSTGSSPGGPGLCIIITW